ncbi:hypothetical protein SLS60_006638 [Paraconiothyrium brasiliense]|uniref:Uncharacterized protein n=1 Tax=Paraconiothyrium brasiliense TaxID=300254 RepID=A0ABR3RBY4_9PLEO
MKAISVTLAFIISSPVLAAPLIHSIPTIVTNEPTTLINTSRKPTATMIVDDDASHYGPRNLTPQSIHKRALPPRGREQVDRLSLVNRDCSAFTDEDRAWIAGHPELSSVLGQCESGELYQHNTPTEDHVDVNAFCDDFDDFIRAPPGPERGTKEELVTGRKHVGKLHAEKNGKVDE